MRRMSRAYREDIEPVVTVLRKAKSERGVLRSLGVTLLDRMGTEALTTALAVETVKAAGAGAASAIMRRRTTHRATDRASGRLHTVGLTINVLTDRDFTARSFDEAAAQFRRKAALTHDEFEELKREQRREAFRIATVHNARLIQSVHDAMERAIREGTSFRDWRNEVLALFDTKGIPPPMLHRLKLAFRQNVLQAYSDARHKTLTKPEIARAFPFWQYMTIGNGRAGYKNVRASHAALHGIVLPVTDPFWDRHRPPWEYNCRCFYTPLTANQVKGRKLKVRNVGYVRKRLGIQPHPDFVMGKNIRFNLTGLVEEIRKAVEEKVK